MSLCKKTEMDSYSCCLWSAFRHKRNKYWMELDNAKPLSLHDYWVGNSAIVTGKIFVDTDMWLPSSYSKVNI